MLKNKKYHIFFSTWLVVLITLVSLIIIVGGLTRLTESGLSITKWELFSGILPPFTVVEWENYFLQYQEIPQFILLNSLRLSIFLYHCFRVLYCLLVSLRLGYMGLRRSESAMGFFV